MNRTCRDIQDLLTLHLAGDLPTASDKRLQAHLQTCPDCQAALADLQPAFEEIRQELAAAPADLPRLSGDRRTRILNAARQAAARETTFADRLARWMDAGFRPSVRIVANTAVILLIMGLLGGLLMPSLSMTRERGRRVQALNAEKQRVLLETLAREEDSERSVDLMKSDLSIRRDHPAVYGVAAPAAPAAPAPPASGPVSEAKPVGDVAGVSAGEAASDAPNVFYRNLPAYGGSGGGARTETIVNNDKAPAPPAESPVVFKGLWTGRSSMGADSNGRRSERKASLAITDEDSDHLTANEPVAPPQATRGIVDAVAASSLSGGNVNGTLVADQSLAFDYKVESGDTLGRLGAAKPSGSTAPADRYRDAEPAAASRKKSEEKAKDKVALGELASADHGWLEREKDGRKRNEETKRITSADGSMISDVRDAWNPKKAEADEAPKTETESVNLFRAWGVNPFIETAKQPFSTFSIDVDTASYTFTRNHLLQGKLPPPEAVRTEEIVNFFDYHYSPPAADAMFAVHSQCAPSPFRPGQQLLRIGVKARHLGREENRISVLTFAVDTSGSMSSPERLGLVQRALGLLVEKLSPDDLVAIVQFDSHARLVLDYTRAADKARILAAIRSLQTSGSTNLEEGMRLAYESARRAFQPGAGNRVLLLSDGAANLGGSTADEILAVVADSRRQGILCSVYGVGRGGLNDAMLESLANKGDGSYVYLDSLDEARRVFVDELAATLNTVAADVKIQVEFTPSRVEQYRQLGYENRQLKKEDFRNDAIDAGEVGSGQSVTALYELGLAAGSRGPLGVVRIRYRDLRTGRIEEIAAPLAESMLVPAFSQSEPAFQLAACAAEWAEILRGSPYADGDDPRELANLLRRAALQYALDSRVQECLRLVETTARLKGDSR